jgi:hypothetical protein
VHRKIPLLFLILILGFSFNGCVSMSAQARRERAYRHYVQKQFKQRRREMARAQKAANRETKRKVKSLEPSEPKVTTSVQSVPETSSQPISSSQPEPVIDPITVSASDSPQHPDQPSPP